MVIVALPPDHAIVMDAVRVDTSGFCLMKKVGASVPLPELLEENPVSARACLPPAGACRSRNGQRVPPPGGVHLLSRRRHGVRASRYGHFGRRSGRCGRSGKCRRGGWAADACHKGGKLNNCECLTDDTKAPTTDHAARRPRSLPAAAPRRLRIDRESESIGRCAAATAATVTVFSRTQSA
jgi:hypothetical protein